MTIEAAQSQYPRMGSIIKFLFFSVVTSAGFSCFAAAPAATILGKGNVTVSAKQPASAMVKKIGLLYGETVLDLAQNKIVFYWYAAYKNPPIIDNEGYYYFFKDGNLWKIAVVEFPNTTKVIGTAKVEIKDGKFISAKAEFDSRGDSYDLSVQALSGNMFHMIVNAKQPTGGTATFDVTQSPITLVDFRNGVKTAHSPH